MSEETGAGRQIRSGSRYPEKQERPQSKSRYPEKKEKPQEESWQERLKARKIRRFRIAAGVFFGVIAVIYIAVSVYFRFHFYEGTTIYGVDCSQMTAREAKDAAADRLEDYTLTLEERGGVSEKISARQIELKFVDNGSFERALKGQHSFLAGYDAYEPVIPGIGFFFF